MTEEGLRANAIGVEMTEVGGIGEIAPPKARRQVGGG